MKASLTNLFDQSGGCEVNSAKSHLSGQVSFSRGKRATQRHKKVATLVSLVASDCVSERNERQDHTHGLGSKFNACFSHLKRRFVAAGDGNRRKLLQCRSRSAFKYVALHERAKIGAVAGAFAGGFTHAALHPIDTVKTKLQTRGASALYSGPLDVVRQVFASQGVKGFYSGALAATYGSMLSSAVYFGVYELGKGVLLNVQGMPRNIVPPLAAAFGNVMSSALLVPKEVIKQRMQAGAIGSSLDVLRRTVAAEGIGGLYVGYSAALLRNLPTNVINFTAYETLRGFWLQRQQQHRHECRRGSSSSRENGRSRRGRAPSGELQLHLPSLPTAASSSVSSVGAGSHEENGDNHDDDDDDDDDDAAIVMRGMEALAPWQSAVCGAVSGALSSGLTTPLDVAKTRLMTQARNNIATAAAAAATQASTLTQLPTSALSSSSSSSSATAAAAAAAARIKVHASSRVYTYRGLASTLHRIWAEEGCRGLTRGLGPRLLYGACFSALGFAAFETFKAALLLRHLEEEATATTAATTTTTTTCDGSSFSSSSSLELRGRREGGSAVNSTSSSSRQAPESR